MTYQVPALTIAEPEMPEGLDDRAADGWEPLLAIADAASGNWPERARHAALVLSGSSVKEDESYGVLMLADLRTLFEQTPEDGLPTATILNHLNGLDESPWATWAKGKGLAAQHLAKILKPYDVRPGTIRPKGGSPTVKGYRLEDLHETFTRYLSPSPPPLSGNVTPSQRGNGAVESKFEAVTKPPILPFEIPSAPHNEAVVTALRINEGGEGESSINDVVEPSCGHTDYFQYTPGGELFCGACHSEMAEAAP